MKNLGIFGNTWEWVKTPVGIFGNSKEFPIIRSLEFLGIIENLWEFLGILNNSKNFKVTVNLGLYMAYFWKNDKCSKVNEQLKNFNNHFFSCR